MVAMAARTGAAAVHSLLAAHHPRAPREVVSQCGSSGVSGRFTKVGNLGLVDVN